MRRISRSPARLDDLEVEGPPEYDPIRDSTVGTMRRMVDALEADGWELVTIDALDCADADLFAGSRRLELRRQRPRFGPPWE